MNQAFDRLKKYIAPFGLKDADFEELIQYCAIEEFSKGTQNSFSSPLAFSVINKKIISKISLNTQLYPYGSIYPSNIKNGSLMTDKRTYIGKIDIQRLQIQLIGEDGSPLNLNGSDFSFGLEIEYE